MNIGIIGCGIIGSRLGQNWRKAGHAVVGWNRTPANAQDVGFPLMESPAMVARRADIIVMVVADSAALLALTEGPGGIAHEPLKGKVVMNASTVGPGDNQRAACAVEAAGGEFLEIPFTGSKSGAEAGQLVFYVGGDPALFRRMEPLLLETGRRCIHFGPVGTAADAKLVINMMLANLMQAMAEGINLAQKAGLDMAAFIDAYRENAGYTVLADMKVGKMISGDYSTHFSLKHMDKDIRLALARAEALKAACPLTKELKTLYSAGIKAGLGDDDFCVLYKLLQQDQPHSFAG